MIVFLIIVVIILAILGIRFRKSLSKLFNPPVKVKTVDDASVGKTFVGKSSDNLYAAWKSLKEALTYEGSEASKKTLAHMVKLEKDYEINIPSVAKAVTKG